MVMEAIVSSEKPAPAKLKTSKYNISISENLHSYLLVNTRTTAALRIRDSNLMPVYHALLNTEAPFNINLDDACVEFLSSNGFIVPEEFDEIKWLESLHWKARIGSDALGLAILVTLGCNFRCTYCYQKHPNIHLSKQLEDAIAKYLLINLHDKLLLRLTWFGGEPLLRLNTIRRLGSRILDIVHSHQIKYEGRISTNGFLLTDEACDVLLQVGVTDIQITLDGPPLVHDKRRFLVNSNPTFQTILRNLEGIAGKFPRVTIRINIDKRNQDEIQRLLEDYLYNLRKHIILAFRNTSSPQWPEVEETWCPTSKTYWSLGRKLNSMADQMGFRTALGYAIPGTTFCSGYQQNSISIDPYGLVNRCNKFIGMPEHAYGTITSEGNIDAVNGQQQQWDNWSPFLDEECRNCKALPLCMGGCLLYLNKKERKSNTLRCFAKHDLVRGILQDVAFNEWLDLGHHIQKNLERR
jgi:uncharacterized protein